MSFKDYFSTQSVDYAKYRPDYPKELFDFIIAHTRNRHLAWDCATGNGQVAIALSPYFDQVIATDASEKQIKAAIPNKRVNYKVAPAEDSSLLDSSVDLITVGQAIHWFDFDVFYKEAKRVAAPDALLVIFGYGSHTVNEAVDEVNAWFYDTLLGSYWPKERKYIDEEYRTVPFPFTEITAPKLAIEKHMNVYELMGYLGTWSSTQQYIKANGQNPLELLEADLIKAWGDPLEVKKVSWPLYIKAGYIR
jgi:SAM-dependent methyltransferase